MRNDIGLNLHSIILTPTLQKHDKVKVAIYKQIWKYLSNDYAIIYVAEPDPPRVIQQMSRVASDLAVADGKEIEDYITSRALLVINRNEFYSPHNTTEQEIHKLTSSLHSLVLEVQKRSKSKGIVAIGDPLVLCETGERRQTRLTQYESALGREFAEPLQAICWYNDPEVVAKMSFSDLVNLINAHHSTIHSGWIYREWTPYDVITQVKGGMERLLGKGTTNLVLKTLKLVYKIDPEKAITYMPELFEEKLSKIMGDSVAKLLFEVLSDTLRKEVSFNRIAQLH
ncbi:MAG TPA: MEDS domain-containing protein [Nitrososphaera sp.]|nr:MEDS domain-containing protein [Nitrososphaera sp.]